MTDAFLASDALPLAIAALIVAEAIALSAWMARNERRTRIPVVLSFLGAGIAFAAALYFHRRAEGGDIGFALSMIAALALHLRTIALLLRP